jgi:hypothetical protein
MSLIEVSKAAIDYAGDSLNEGLSLARHAQSALFSMTSFAVVPEGVTREQALNFSHGGLGRCDISEVAVLLSQRYPSGLVVVELPLWRLEDPGAVDSTIRTLSCGDEVYATCPLDAPPARIEETLRTADPSFMYNAIVIEDGGNRDLSGCPTEWVEGGTARICAVMIGAYDGEGFVLAERRGTTFSQ